MKKLVLILFLTAIVIFFIGCPGLFHKAPELDIPDHTVVQGSVLEIDLLDFVDSEPKEDLTFEVVEGVGEIVSISLYRYSPGYIDPDEREVKIRVTDNRGNSAEDTFTISILPKTYDVVLIANPSEGGEVTGEGTYNHGEGVEVEATPNTGWEFVEWTEDSEFVSNDRIYTFEIVDDRELVANFTLKTYTLTVTIEGEGTVTKDPDKEEYTHGEVVLLGAEADPGWKFVKWVIDGEDVSESETEVTITKDIEAVAHFARIEYSLTLTTVGEGQVLEEVIFTPTGYEYETEVKLTAVPDEGWQFSHWSGDLTGSDNPETILMNEDKEVTAHFAEKSYKLTTLTEGQGTVTRNPDKAAYDHDEEVELTALPDEGWQFSHWSGDLTGSDNPDTIVMDESKEVTAHFSLKQYTVILTANPPEGGEVTGEGIYSHNEEVEVEAIPNTGWKFVKWTESEELISEDLLFSFPIISDRELVANFQKENLPPDIPYNPSPVDGADDQPVDVTLSWDCSDPDGDPLVYDIYFGTVENPPIVAEEEDEKSFVPGRLEYNTKYYWKIVARDNRGGVTEGPEWKFTTEVEDDFEVVFADPVLEQVIREAIGKPSGPILKSDVSLIELLWAEGRGISDLSGIEHLENLRRLFIQHNSVKDLSPLSGLSSLRELNFWGNRASDLQPLASLVGLEHLFFEGNSVIDLSPLAGLENLKTLMFWDNAVTDLSPLAGLTNLEELLFYKNRVSDLSPLSELIKLRKLDFDENYVSDLSPIAGLVNLEYLVFGWNQVTDLAPIAGLVNLNRLNFPSNSVTCLSPLAGLKKLEHLGFGWNSVSDLSPLATLASLQSLGFRDNLVSDLGPIAGLKSLRQIMAHENSISNITALSNLTDLEEIVLRDNMIEDISAVENLENLELLDLSSNRISDINPLVANPSIGQGDWIDIRHNFLDLDPGSETLLNIQALIDRGVYVLHSPQGYPLPNRPSNPDPQNYSSDVPITSLLSWDCSHPAGNVLVFDVYFGTVSQPPLVEANHEQNNYNPGLLQEDTTYYWKIIAVDEKGETSEGPLWAFSTGEGTSFQVTFPDPNLEQVVRETIGKPTGPIYRDEVSKVKLLDASARQISDLSGIQAFENLETFYFGNNYVSDLSPIEALENLRRLDFSANSIVELSPISGLSGLQHLDFSSNSVESIMPLAGLTNLEYLYFGSNSVKDISALSGLVNLKTLFFWNNTVIELSPIAGLANLQGLDFENNWVSDLSALTNLVNLEHLYFGNNSVWDISPLCSLTNLVGLGFHNNSVSDLAPIAGLKKLTYLYAQNNLINDISALSNLTNLKNLQLGNNLIESIEGLCSVFYEIPCNRPGNYHVVRDSQEDRRTIVTEYLSSIAREEMDSEHTEGNYITSISVLSNLTELKYLGLSNNMVENISPLGNLAKLDWLDLYNNVISDVRPLVDNPGIAEDDWIDIRYNSLKLVPGSDDMDNIQALLARGVNLLYYPQEVDNIGAFKIANSWGVGGWENVPDGFLYMTYDAAVLNNVWTFVMDPGPAHEPRLLAVFQISHQYRDDCEIYVGIGDASSPSQEKRFDSTVYRGGPWPFPDNKIVFDITEFLPLSNEDIYIRIFDSPKTPAAGILESFSVEYYSNYNAPPSEVYHSSDTPMNTINSSSIVAAVEGVTAYAIPAFSILKIDDLFETTTISPEKLREMKESIGVYEEGVNYNTVIDGFGTGLRPPTEEEWEKIPGIAQIIDSPVFPTELPESVDHSESIHFPPIGNQGSKGSCTAFSVGYYIATYYEASKRNWDLSSAEWIGGQPTASYQEKIISPDFIYHQINDGKDEGSYQSDAMALIGNIGAASWNKMPYDTGSYTTWPSEAAWREAPKHRNGPYHYCFRVQDYEDIETIKLLISEGYMISIIVDAGRYSAMTGNDTWNTSNYSLDSIELSHANTIVGYDDTLDGMK